MRGHELESGLVEAMLADTDTEGPRSPLLALALRELFDHFGDDGLLEVKEYREFGGLHGSLALVAEQLVESQALTSIQEDELRRAFLAMVRLTDDDRWVRHVARWDELPDVIHPLLERFVDARLLVSGGDHTARTIEVAHEAMFRTWGRLSDWLLQDAEAMRLRRDLRYAAAAWRTSGEPSTDLWRGARLSRATELMQSDDLSLDDVDTRFLDASLLAYRAEADAKERSRRRKLRTAAAVTAGALLLAAIRDTVVPTRQP